MSERPNLSEHSLDLEQVRAWFQKMIAAAKFGELVSVVVALIVRMRDANTELRKQLAHLQRKRPKSETLARVEEQTVFAFMKAEGGAQAKLKKKDGRKGRPPGSRKGVHPGRTPLPPDLERIPVPNPVPAKLRICPRCGTEMRTLGHEVACETLELIPARLVVLQRIDETVACPHDDTIVSASPPAQIVERGLLGPQLIVEALSDKYLEQLPIERQCQRYRRAGVPLAPQTLSRSVNAAIDLLTPVAKMIHQLTKGPGLLATDATGLPVLDTDAPNGIRTGTMWCWTNDAWVSFVYAPSGDSQSVRDFLGEDLARLVQCDGTSVLSFIEREGGRRPGCWAHARRRLVEAARGDDLLAIDGLRLIKPLFVIEQASAKAGESAEERLLRRQQSSSSVVTEIRSWVDAHQRAIAPKTPMGKALGYLSRQWSRLTLFLEDGRIELTNNRVERELRRLVLGRRNWLFTWEDQGGERTATALTIVATCIAHGINPRPFLHRAVKLLIDGWPQSRLRDLLPDRIAQLHPELKLGSGPPLLALPASA